MKKITVILAIILASLTQNFAQFYNKGAQVTVQNGIVLKIDGDFLNDINSNFKNESKVIIKGNVTNNQTMGAPTAGLWEFSGTTSQNFAGIYPLQVYDINFNNGAGFILNNGIKTYNQANFTNGIVNSSDANLLIFGENSFIPINPSDASHVVGPVAKQGLESFTFPVGDPNKYQPIKADFTQNTGGFIAKYMVGNAGSGNFSTAGAENTALTSYNSNEYWDLQPLNEGNTTAQITLFWDNFNDFSTIETNQRKVAHKVGPDWLNEGSTSISGNTTNGFVRSSLISDWSPFALGFVSAAPLPLNLLNFSAKKAESGNQLNWLTSNEVGVSHFEIEKSENGKSFEKIGEVKANGGPAENVEYEYIDNQNSNLITHNSSLYYRLKMIDLDGKYSYSKIVFLKNDISQFTKLKLFPNPAISVLNIENMSKNTIEIVNINGQNQAIKLLSQSDSKSSIDVSALPKGIYLLKVGNEVGKFLKE